MVNWNVTFNDNPLVEPIGRDAQASGYALVFLNLPSMADTDKGSQQSTVRDIITQEVKSAGQQWAQHFKNLDQSSLTVNVKVAIDPYIATSAIADDANSTIISIGTDPSNKKTIAETPLAYKLSTGKAPSTGGSPDVIIHISPNLVDKQG